MSDPLFLVAAALLGATIGSFLNVVVYRMPRPEAASFGRRSVCPQCRTPIPWFLNLPVVGWVALRGRARCCGARISSRYPLIESLTAGLFFLLAAYPPSGAALNARAFEFLALCAFAFHAYFVANLVANTFIDLDFRILPDRLTKPMMAVGVIGSFLLPDLVGGRFTALSIGPAANSLLFSLCGLATGFALTYGVRELARIAFGKEAMGFGDVKLMAGVGAFLGWDGALLTFFLGCVAGAIGGGIGRLFTRDPYVAFGPYLALGAVIVLFASAPIIEFLTDTWPRWQQEHASSPWVLALVSLVSVSLLLLLIRRGRST